MSSWKEASTLILTALKGAPVASNWDYKLLTLRRSSQSSFMPKGHVFPGGATDSGDGDQKWLDFFSYFHVDLSNVLKLSGKVPPIIAKEGLQIPKLLSLKITAIRETFEETGILLCFSKNKSTENPIKWGSFSVFEGLDLWRAKVQKDASEFFNMCQFYKCCPDVSNLHLWSNWLTPTSKGPKRFDAVFFIATLGEKPLAVADKSEIEKLSWISPEELMKLNKAKKLWLPPPQFYEISRLLQFKQIEILNKFASNRSIQGCERWMPVQITTLNGMVSVLPGDDAYGTPDFSLPTERAQVKMTSEEFRSQFKVLHRMEFVDTIQTKIIIKDYNPTCGHVLPSEES